MLQSSQNSRLRQFKGGISKGKHADFLVWDPYDSQKFEENQYFIYPETHIFLNKKFYGVVKKTFLRGKLIYDRDVKENSFIEKTGNIVKKSYFNK